MNEIKNPTGNLAFESVHVVLSMVFKILLTLHLIKKKLCCVFVKAKFYVGRIFLDEDYIL